jgi:NADH-quinone oxidoreductase subunit G
MEEGSELLHRLADPIGHKYPMFTSCCPGWVRFIKAQYPELVDDVSTSKSPQQMFGAIIKSYYAELLGVDPHRIFSVSIMPCLLRSRRSPCLHARCLW